MATAPSEIATDADADAAVPIALTINGHARRLEVAPGVILLDLLRNELGLTGSKKGCDHGQCGACTVLVDGRGANSCLLLAVMQDGKEITTIEGVAPGDELHPMQAAFLAHDAFQCGYCTPGQICSALSLVGEGHARTADEIREYMSGNLCRCAAYPQIVAAVADVLAQGRGEGGGRPMMHFAYTRAGSVAEAARAGAVGLPGDAAPAAAFIAGGTNLLDLAKADVLRPRRVVDLTRLPLMEIADLPDGGLRLGALATNADTARDARVVARYPLLSKAILAGASPQLRNVATNGGNLLQRTRCYYFYDAASPCNKRRPGSGCAALGGVNRLHAILGASDRCIATHPSDMCVALAALAAVVQVSGVDGDRAIPFADLHRLPGDAPEVDHTLRPGEVITSIDLPPAPDGFARHSTYLKVRDRASYAFAVVSAAAALDLDGDTIRSARLALGGVAHKPWRDEEAEALLVGRPATAESFGAVADHVLRDARGHEHNAFKIPLARNVIVKAFEQAARGA